MGVCDGTMARAMPSCAAVAMRWACAWLRTASVATMAIVVASPARFISGGSAPGAKPGGRPRPPNSPPISQGAAQKCGPAPTVTDPIALTATSAPTVMPLSSTAEAEPSPPFRSWVSAPVPAPAVPSANARSAASSAARPSGL